MKFHLKMTIELKKEFDIEAEHLKDAREIAEKQLLEEVDLNTLEVISIGLDMTDPSILEYNGKMCKMRASSCGNAAGRLFLSHRFHMSHGFLRYCLVVWERLCNFDLRSKVGCISEIKTKKAFFVLYFARFALPLHDDETGKDFSTIRLDSHHAPTAWCIDAGAAGQAVGG